MKSNAILILWGSLVTIFLLGCGGLQMAAQPTSAPTRTPLPTFTLTPLPAATSTPLPTATATFVILPTDTNTPLPLPPETPLPTATPLPTNTATPLLIPPTPTPEPSPTASPTVTPIPKPVINYVLAATNREFNCNFTAIYGTVKNANNFGIPNVAVRAVGIKGTGGDFTGLTDAEGNYKAFRIPLPELQAGQWAVMVMENGVEASERFHWASTPVCDSDDTGHSQVLRVDWKLIE